MKIKKIYAPSMAEAMEKIKKELGQDAVILNSKVLYSGGFLGFFKKKSFEVLAAIDPQPMANKQQPNKKEKIKIEEPENQGDSFNRLIQTRNNQDSMVKEITELKQLVKNLNTHNAVEHANENIRKVIGILRVQEIADETIDDIVIVLMEQVQNEAVFEEYLEKTKEYLLSKIPVAAHGVFQKKYVNVVGPTGVGKTTTLAKLAAESVLKHGKKVAFITTDTYRIAAIEQLKTYATILNIPIEVAYNMDDFKKAKEKFAHYDTVFIDTAGRNFRNRDYVEELQKLISFNEDLETYLVLSLTSKQRDMEEILHQFSLIPIAHFIFTKMDETSSYGAIFNMMNKYNVNTAFMTNGQNVPDDIVRATPANILNHILGVSKHVRSS